jgi:uracil-DNA glycosylase
MEQVQLTLLIGLYAQRYYLREHTRPTLTDTVQGYADYLPEYIPLPHPSPRNDFWLRRNLWFEQEVVPVLQERIQGILMA